MADSIRVAEIDQPNVTFQRDVRPFGEMCEASYLAGIFRNLALEMGQNFFDYQFIIFSGRSTDYLQISDCDPRNTVIIQISDELSGVPHELCGRTLAVFKNYLPSERLLPNLFSLPLGYVVSTPYLPPLPMRERRYDVFFSGALRKNRRKLFRVVANPHYCPILLPYRLLAPFHPLGEHLKFVGNSYIPFTERFRDGLPGDKYAEILTSSRVALCPSGYYTPETFRHFEAMRAGAIVVSEPLPELDFYVGSPIVVIRDWRSARRTIQNLLADPDALAERQQRTLDWWERHCSEHAVAIRMASAISELSKRV